MSAPDDADALCAVLRRALALVRGHFHGDLHALVGEAVERAAPDQPPGPLSLQVLGEIQRTLSRGEPFGDPATWAARATPDELRAVLEATLTRLQGHGPL